MNSLPVAADSDDVVFDGVLNELRCRLHVELPHHPVFVEGDRPRGEVQHGGDLLHRAPPGEQLQHFPLPRRQLA